jgi:hypothetical protein
MEVSFDSGIEVVGPGGELVELLELSLWLVSVKILESSSDQSSLNGSFSKFLDGLFAWSGIVAPLDSMPGIETKSLQLSTDIMEVCFDSLIEVVRPCLECVELLESIRCWIKLHE